MSELIIVRDGVLDYAQQFLRPSDQSMPPREAVRDAIVAVARHSIDVGLAPGSPPVSWTPPEPIGEYTELGVLQVRADWVVMAHAPAVPGRALHVSLRQPRRAVDVFAVTVTDPPLDAIDVLDPVAYGYEEAAEGVVVVSWPFNRLARNASIEVSRPLGSSEPWHASLIELYRAGEQVGVAPGPLVINALRHEGLPLHVRRGRRVQLYEDAHVMTAMIEVPTVRDGFDRLFERLALSPRLRQLGSEPDSRLR